MTWVGEGGSGTAYLGAQPVKLYADAASTVTLTVLKSRDINHLYSGWVGGYISISGYLVNIP